MVFLNFTEIPWAEASVNTKAHRHLEEPWWGWKGKAQSWRKPFSLVVREKEGSSSGGGGHPPFGSQLFPVPAGKREGVSVYQSNSIDRCQ